MDIFLLPKIVFTAAYKFFFLNIHYFIRGLIDSLFHLRVIYFFEIHFITVVNLEYFLMFFFQSLFPSIVFLFSVSVYNIFDIFIVLLGHFFFYQFFDRKKIIVISLLIRKIIDGLIKFQFHLVSEFLFQSEFIIIFKILFLIEYLLAL